MLVIDTTLTEDERQEWNAQLEDAQTWIELKDLTEKMLKRISEKNFDRGYKAAMAKCNILLGTCRAIAEGAGIMGDPATYPEYVRTMCRNAMAEFIEPFEEIDPRCIKLGILAPINGFSKSISAEQ